MPRPHPITSLACTTRRLAATVMTLAVICVLAGCARFGDSALVITPTVFSECQGTDIVVHVAWDATRQVRQQNVKLFVYKPGQLPKLWMVAAPKGTADTGRWASDGWTVMLEDAQGRVLGMRTLQATPCSRAPD